MLSLLRNYLIVLGAWELVSDCKYLSEQCKFWWNVLKLLNLGKLCFTNPFFVIWFLTMIEHSYNAEERTWIGLFGDKTPHLPCRKNKTVLVGRSKQIFILRIQQLTKNCLANRNTFKSGILEGQSFGSTKSRVHRLRNWFEDLKPLLCEPWHHSTAMSMLGSSNFAYCWPSVRTSHNNLLVYCFLGFDILTLFVFFLLFFFAFLATTQQ